MGILDGKRLLVTGVLTDSSIAFHVARIAQEQGAQVVLTSFGRTMKITTTIARRLPQTPPVVELDVQDAEHLETLADRLGEHVDGLDGVLHSIGFAPQGAFDFMNASWEDVSTALHVSAFSLKAVAKAALPLMSSGGSVVGLTFDARYAWPVYDTASARTSSPPDPSARPPPRASPRSRRSRAPGATGRRSVGTCATPSRPHARAAHCCRTGSRRPRAR
jgi:enoyl ACP reductase